MTTKKWIEIKLCICFKSLSKIFLYIKRLLNTRQKLISNSIELIAGAWVDLTLLAPQKMKLKKCNFLRFLRSCASAIAKETIRDDSCSRLIHISDAFDFFTSYCIAVTLSFFYKQQFISNKLETGQIFRKSKQLTGYILKK